MAERPVFIPLTTGKRLVSAAPVTFTWHSGMAPSQKKKNVAALHAAAAERGLKRLLEVSSKSEMEIGRRLSAFHLTVEVEGVPVPLECAFQAAKVFEHGGPFEDLLEREPREAKQDERLRTSGRIIGFRLAGQSFPTQPPTAFYDWLYCRALLPEREWLRRLSQIQGFTDIEFNPERSLNCQARACALFVALEARGLLDEAMGSFDRFRDLEAEAFALA